MWIMKCCVITVIIGSTGIVTKGLNAYLEAISGKHSINSLQKHIKRKGTANSRSERWSSPLVQGKKYWDKPV
jgi:hypothetical protein